MQQTEFRDKRQRNRVLARIHVAKRDLALQDEDYREILARVTGKRSAADLEMVDVLPLQNELRRLGWQGWLVSRDEAQAIRRQQRTQAKRYADCDDRIGYPNGAQLRKLDALFKGVQGFADIRPDEAFRRFLENRFKISHAKFLDSKQYERALKAVREMRERYGVKPGYQEW
jgi:hypothetical protein